MLPASNQKLEVAVSTAKLDAILAEFDRSNLPGFSVGIAQNGETKYLGTVGLANVELGIALLPTQRVRVGTITKQFVCFALLLLCERGQASLEDTLSKYFPNLAPVAEGVKLRNLLGNTSGLRDPLDLCFQFSGWGDGVAAAELLGLYECIADANDKPGTTWNYNHGDWLLAGRIIEVITGLDLSSALRSLVFEPIGMFDTELREFDSFLISNSALAHMRGLVGFERSACMDFSGAGAATSTIKDLLRWLAHMDAPIVGGKATWDMMFSEPVLTNGSQTGYCYGFAKGRFGVFDTFQYSGAWLGAGARVIKIPSLNFSLVVGANSLGGLREGLIERLLEACVPEIEKSVTSPVSAAVEGVFVSQSPRRVVQLISRDGRQVVSIDGSDYVANSTSVDQLRLEIGAGTWPAKMSIDAPSARDPILTLTLTEFGNRSQYTRIGANAPRIDPIDATYSCKECGIKLKLEETSGSWAAKSTGPFGELMHSLTHLAGPAWRLNSHSSGISIGAVLIVGEFSNELVLSNGRTKAMCFRRQVS